MAISDGTAGAWAAGTTRNQTVTLPAHSAGQMLLVRVGWKSSTPTTDVSFCNTSGWAKIGQFYDGNGASSNGGGGVLVAAFWKEATSGSETNPVIEFDDATAPSPGCWAAVSYNKASTDVWSTPVGDGGAIAAATNYSGTIQTHVSAASGDMLDAFAVTNDNTTLTVPTVAQTGLTLDTVTEYPAAALSSATSNDISADGSNRLATAGTSSAAAVVSGTNSIADTGAAWVTRLRVTGVTGTGSVTVPAATVAGTGSHVEPVTGTGAITVPAATVAGTGVEEFTATGAVSVPSATVAGTGEEGFTATGAITGQAPTVAGTGESTLAEPTATGAIVVPSATVEGTGSLGLTATGAVSVPSGNVAGTGAEGFTATGAVTGQPPVVAGTGIHAAPVTGTGAVVGQAPSVSGTGLHTQPVTGTGAIVGRPPAVAGVGVVPVEEMESSAAELRKWVVEPNPVFIVLVLIPPAPTMEIVARHIGPFSGRMAIEVSPGEVRMRARNTSPLKLRRRELEDAQILATMIDRDDVL